MSHDWYFFPCSKGKVVLIVISISIPFHSLTLQDRKRSTMTIHSCLLFGIPYKHFCCSDFFCLKNKSLSKIPANLILFYVPCICLVANIIRLINLYQPFLSLFSELKHWIRELSIKNLGERWLKQKLEIVFNNEFHTRVFNWTWGDLRYIFIIPCLSCVT